MDWLMDLITNPFLITGLASWFIAQVLKTIIHGVINRKVDWTRLFGDGGMPSGHSATVSSVAVLSALLRGAGSFEFAVSTILAVIVCHDAMGVRLEAGKQAAVINDLQHAFNILSSEELPEIKLKEFVGHTPTQVIAGILIGIANAIATYFLWFR